MRGTSIKLDLHSTSSEYVLEEKYDESVCVPLFFLYKVKYKYRTRACMRKKSDIESLTLR